MMELEGPWRPLKINVRNLIGDFLEMYSAGPAEVMVMESIANSLDASAARIRVGLSEAKECVVFSVADDGTGMDEQAFENSYHALALSTKEKGKSIGFAGVGGKLYLAMLQAGRSIYTETRSEDFFGASELAMKGDEAVWRRVEPRGRLKTKTGTHIEVEMQRGALDRERVERTIQDGYNAVLLGMCGNVSVFLDWKSERLWPALPMTTVASELFTFRVRGKKCVACFWLARDEFDAPRGLDIAVLGKKVKGEQWFNLQFEVRPEFSRRVYGLVNADVLANLLTANKQDLRVGNDKTWVEFRRRTYTVFRRWLARLGAVHRTAAARPAEMAVASEVARAVTGVLRLPSLSMYHPGVHRAQGDGVTKQTAVNDLKASKLSASVSRRAGGSGPKAGPVGRAPRRGGAGSHLGLSIECHPEVDEEAWVGSTGIVINSGHPVFQRNRRMGTSMEAMHMTRCAFMALIENNDPGKKEILDELRNFYKGWASLD
jgi:hypothetical protein